MKVRTEEWHHTHSLSLEETLKQLFPDMEGKTFGFEKELITVVPIEYTKAVTINYITRALIVYKRN